ncbi:PEP-CTERM sorting domain-containing protein [Aliiglaciecola litoralis]|uniref:Ice-binding protein C-terminal domain-containing protein n=1 Tax=Aliiglaciecola litoralis TaxID=582857 RepID=A0ABN1LSK0_9ALTE
MKSKLINFTGATMLLLATCLNSVANAAIINVGVIADDGVNVVAAYLDAFADINVTAAIQGSSNVTGVGDLSGFDAVFVWTNSAPSDAVAWGDILRDYSDVGGGIVMNTYGMSMPWAIQGGITDNGYAPFSIAGNTNTTGSLVATMADSLFNNVDLTQLAYWNNSNYADPTLSAGATLLATDGNGVNMIARNASQNIIAMNIYPGNQSNDEYWQLAANALQQVAGNVNDIPEPTTLAIFALGLFGLATRRAK